MLLPHLLDLFLHHVGCRVQVKHFVARVSFTALDELVLDLLVFFHDVRVAEEKNLGPTLIFRRVALHLALLFRTTVARVVIDEHGVLVVR